MRLTQLAGAVVILLTAAPRDACRNECDFMERCDGDIRQTCGGVDQCVGRSLREETCVAPNGACVEQGARANCVRSPATRCDPGFVEQCQGNLRLFCSAAAGGYVAVEDCAVLRLTCGPGDGGRRQCVPPP